MIADIEYINDTVISFFNKNNNVLSIYQNANVLLMDTCGIVDFFNNQQELDGFLCELKTTETKIEKSDRREYGDFQTNNDLAEQVVVYIAKKNIVPEFILEPTCGTGSFILAALKQFKSIKKVIGVEIHLPYIWASKVRILNYYLMHPEATKPDIEIIQANAFEFAYANVSKVTKHLKTLVLGNPPWVTSSELSSIDSQNIPQKSNFKKHRGLDAMTGKGNFDIGENVTLMMLQDFDKHDGMFAFLIKNAVVKNIICEQRKNKYSIANIEKLNINSQKEFNVSVEACLFTSELNQKPEFTCREMDFYSLEKRTELGWVNDKFVYSVGDYDYSKKIDGTSQFVWRQGIKHDCSKIMELQAVNGHFTNGFEQEILLEKDLLFGLLKSSDLKADVTNKYRKLTIVTQKKIGQSTQYIEKEYPLIFEYLQNNKAFFDKRKSSIYNGKPDFSIFGVGDYSFAPYKVAISAMYKTTHFTLVLPMNDKPIMLDDTCYFIGFNDIHYAKIAHFLLNADITQSFLKAISFPDSKRSITKDILMRINLQVIYDLFQFDLVKNTIDDVSKEKWDAFGQLLDNKTLVQPEPLF